MFGWRRFFSREQLDGMIHFPVEEATIPEKVVIPLRQGFGDAALALVQVGDHVQAGQVIAAGEKLCSPVHATINGVVVSFPEVTDHFGEKTPAIEIEATDDSSEFLPLNRFSPQFRKRKPVEIQTLLYRSGVTGLGKNGIPTQFNSSSLPVSEARSVVIAALNLNPFSLSNEIFLRPRLHQFLTGLSILNFALNNLPVYVFINSSDQEIVAFLKSQKKANPWLNIIPCKPKSAQEEESFLKKRKEMSAGAVVLETADVVHAYEAVVEGKPLIDRFVALGGNGFVRNVPLRLRIGTSVASIIEGQTKREQNLKIIVGSFLTDTPYPAHDFPLTRSINRLVAQINT